MKTITKERLAELRALHEVERLETACRSLRKSSRDGFKDGFEACREKAAKAVLKFGPYHGSNWIAEQVMNLTPESDE
jgi:hypothetical protein